MCGKKEKRACGYNVPVWSCGGGGGSGGGGVCDDEVIVLKMVTDRDGDLIRICTKGNLVFAGGYANVRKFSPLQPWTQFPSAGCNERRRYRVYATTST